MTEATDVYTPTTTGGLASGNVNNTRGSTTSSSTKMTTPTSNKNKGRNRNSGKPSNGVKSTLSTVPSVTKSFEGMTPAINIVLLLPGEKVASVKPIDGFCKDFSTYVAANMENGVDVVPIFRDGEDPVEISEKKIFPVLKILDPIDSSASTKEKAQHAAKEKSYENI